MLFLTTFFKASALEIILALSSAAFILPSLYPLERRRFFNSKNRFSIASGRLHILTILRANENGIFSVTCAGWQELVSKY